MRAFFRFNAFDISEHRRRLTTESLRRRKSARGVRNERNPSAFGVGRYLVPLAGELRDGARCDGRARAESRVSPFRHQARWVGRLERNGGGPRASSVRGPSAVDPSNGAECASKLERRSRLDRGRCGVVPIARRDHRDIHDPRSLGRQRARLARLPHYRFCFSCELALPKRRLRFGVE